MTVIATDGKSMAADGLSTQCGVIIDLACRKVDRLADGSLWGSAGGAVTADRVRDWLSDGANGDYPKGEAFTGLRLNPDGTIDLFDDTCNGKPDRVPAPMAIGAGMEPALGAMDAGASPKRAVEIAIKRTPTCGGAIIEEFLK